MAFEPDEFDAKPVCLLPADDGQGHHNRRTGTGGLNGEAQMSVYRTISGTSNLCAGDCEIAQCTLARQLITGKASRIIDINARLVSRVHRKTLVHVNMPASFNARIQKDRVEVLRHA